MPSRVRKGDLVAIMSGDDKGKRGKVLQILVDRDRVVVEGVNLVFKHLGKSAKHPQGGRIRKEAPIHMSNVMPVDPTTNQPTRVRTKVEGGQRIRVGRRSGASLESGAAKKE